MRGKSGADVCDFVADVRDLLSGLLKGCAESGRHLLCLVLEGFQLFLRIDDLSLESVVLVLSELTRFQLLLGLCVCLL